MFFAITLPKIIQVTRITSTHCRSGKTKAVSARNALGVFGIGLTQERLSMSQDIPGLNSNSYLIQAEVGPAFLSKADRLFRNDDLGIFDEILQNSRRAGATLVTVSID